MPDPAPTVMGEVWEVVAGATSAPAPPGGDFWSAAWCVSLGPVMWTTCESTPADACLTWPLDVDYL